MQSMCLGDMKKWKTDIRFDETPTELKEFILEEYKENRNILFISTGIAIQDALVCNFIYSKLKG